MEAHLRKGLVVSQGSDDVFLQAPTLKEGYDDQPPLLTEGCGDSAVSCVAMNSTSLIRSAQGQQARDAYRSSGYGTESGDDANGSAAFQRSHVPSQHSLSDGTCAAVLQGSLIPDLNTEAQKCVENDFKPRNVVLCSGTMNVNSSSAVQIPTEHESDKPFFANQDCSSEQTALSLPKKEVERINASGQPPMSANDPNISTEEVAVNTKEITAAGCQHDFMASSTDVQETSKPTCQNVHGYQRHFTSENVTEAQQTDGNILNHEMAQKKHQQQQQQAINKAPLADSAPRDMKSQQHFPDNRTQESGQPGIETSANKSAVTLETRIKPPFHRQEELQDWRTTSESFDAASKVQITSQPPGHSPSDARSIPDEPDTSASFYLSENPSSFAYQFDDHILKVLEKSARCQEASCDNVDCIQMRKEFALLMDRQGLSSLNEHQLMLLQTTLYHVFHCSHPRCPLPWCADKGDKCLTSEEGIQLIMHRIENYAEYCSLLNFPLKEFVKLNKTFLLDTLPLEGKHWERMCMLKNSRKTILVTPARSDFSEYKYWVIKKIPITKDLHHWNLYSRLRDVNHKFIATMLWAARFEHHLLVCHLFENLSLHDCLHKASPQQLGLTTICHILQQIISAVLHLHSLRIVYLYWMSKNILISCQAGGSFCVKMSNFSCSVFLDSYDGDDLYLTLPPAIMPPELRAEDTVGLVSDVWGLGCLLYEMVTGKPVWHEHRHLPDEDLHVLLGKDPIPAIPSTFPELQSLFGACWETDLSKRKTVTDLELLLAAICV